MKAAQRPGRLTVVLVDDAADLRELVRLRLEVAGGFSVAGEGKTGHDAIRLAGEHQPDLLLLDVSMPEMDGLEAIAGVLAASPGTHVAMFSGFEATGLEERARALGAVDFIEKSVPVSELPDRLRLAAALRVTQAGPLPVTSEAPSGSSGAKPELFEEHLERFRAAFEGATIGMAALTLSGRIVRANATLAQIMRCEEWELFGQLFADVVFEPSRAEVAAAVVSAADVPRPVSIEHRLRGERGDAWVRSTLSAVRDSADRPLYLFLQVVDVTPEHEAARALFTSEQRFRLLLESVSDYAMYTLDVEGNIASWNAGAQKLKGYSAEEILGCNVRVFYTPDARAVHEPERELEYARKMGRYEAEAWRVRKDGSRFWASIVVTALRDERGDLIGFGKVTRDVTERERAAAELAASNEQLKRAAEEKAEFVAVTAHELRGPVQLMRGSAETLLDGWEVLDDATRKRLLETLVSGGSRLSRLLEDLLVTARAEEGKLDLALAPVVVLSVVREAVRGLAGAAPSVNIECPDEMVVMADRRRLLQILTNLLSNAIKHGAPPVSVTTRRVQDRIEIVVRDAGRGVSKVDVPKLFTKFAQLGSPEPGTGLGLFIVRELTRAQGGDVRYERDRTRGSRFIVELPAAARRSPDSNRTTGPRRLPSTAKRQGAPEQAAPAATAAVRSA
jgi:hypothetical protein